MINQDLREDMRFLQGQIDALGFVMSIKHNSGAHDLWESISSQYDSIIKKLFADDSQEIPDNLYIQTYGRSIRKPAPMSNPSPENPIKSIYREAASAAQQHCWKCGNCHAGYLCVKDCMVHSYKICSDHISRCMLCNTEKPDDERELIT